MYQCSLGRRPEKPCGCADYGGVHGKDKLETTEESDLVADNRCRNGHKMVTKLWEITEKYDNNCCESD